MAVAAAAARGVRVLPSDALMSRVPAHNFNSDGRYVRDLLDEDTPRGIFHNDASLWTAWYLGVNPSAVGEVATWLVRHRAARQWVAAYVDASLARRFRADPARAERDSFDLYALLAAAFMFPKFSVTTNNVGPVCGNEAGLRGVVVRNITMATWPDRVARSGAGGVVVGETSLAERTALFLGIELARFISDPANASAAKCEGAYAMLIRDSGAEDSAPLGVSQLMLRVSRARDSMLAGVLA